VMQIHNIFTTLSFAFALSVAAPAPVPGLPGSVPSQIQDCAYGGNYGGAFTDGSGTYIDSDSVRYEVGKKCWNDYFVVDTNPFKGPWYKIGGSFYCTATASCSSGVTTTNQTCLSNTDQISVGISIKTADEASLEFGYQHTWSTETCYSESVNNQCIWNDQQCHTIWAQDGMVQQKGYKRERCNVSGVNGGEDFTNCMSDWQIEWPTGIVSYGCGSKCGDTNPCGNNNGQPCP